MAEIRTTRMRLVQWTEGTDSPQRVDFNETFLNIETLAAIDQQGTYDNRPLPNKTGMYYFATDQGILYRSDGLAWAVVGSSTLSHLVRAARSDSVALTIQAIAGQTADLQRIITTSGATLVRVRSNGDILVGPARISQAARTTTASDTAPTDSAITVDNASADMWGHTTKNTTGNTAGFYRAVRGTSTVFQVAPDGSVTTPAVTLSSAPSSDSHAVRRLDLDTKVSQNVYDINGSNISGILGVSKGGTGRVSLNSGQYVVGAGTAGVTTKTPAQVRADIDAATSGHGHALTDSNITGTLPINQGGTGATTQEAARTALAVPSTSVAINTGAGLSGGGTLAASRTLQVVFEGSGTRTTAARSDHGHALTDANITGVLPVAQGGTGHSTLDAGSYLQGNGTGLPNLRTPTQVLSDIGAAPSVHGHALTDSNITGTLPVAQGGTGATSASAGLGNLGGLPRNIEGLPAGQNINSWTTSGTWVPPNSDVKTSNGYPSSAATSSVVLSHTQINSNHAVQTLMVITNNRMWNRTMRNGTWSPWEPITTTQRNVYSVDARTSGGVTFDSSTSRVSSTPVALIDVPVPDWATSANINARASYMWSNVSRNGGTTGGFWGQSILAHGVGLSSQVVSDRRSFNIVVHADGTRNDVVHSGTISVPADQRGKTVPVSLMIRRHPEDSGNKTQLAFSGESALDLDIEYRS